MAGPELPKLMTWVRFPSPAPDCWIQSKAGQASSSFPCGPGWSFGAPQATDPAISSVLRVFCPAFREDVGMFLSDHGA